MRERPRSFFRHKVLSLLREKGLLSQQRIELLLSWRRSGFSVHNRVYVSAGDRQGLEALARYLMRSPVSLSRLRYTPGSSEVVYLHKDKGGHDAPEPSEGERVDAMEFVARVLVQIPDSRRHSARHYGAYSNAARGKRRKAAAVDPPSGPTEAPERETTVANGAARVALQAPKGGDDPPGVRSRPFGVSSLWRRDARGRVHHRAPPDHAHSRSSAKARQAFTRSSVPSPFQKGVCPHSPRRGRGTETLGILAGVCRDESEKRNVLPLRLRFLLPDGGPALECEATVTWINIEWPQRIDNLPPGCGLRFASMQPQEHKRIEAVVEDYRCASHPMVARPQPHSGFTPVPYVQPCTIDGALPGVICNISLTGLYVAVDPIPVYGQTVTLAMGFPGTESPIEIRAEVAWINPDEPTKVESLPVGCGLRFVGLPDDVAQAIMALVEDFVSIPRELPPWMEQPEEPTAES